MSIKKMNVLVRYLIMAAEDKRFVQYHELNKIIGIPLQSIPGIADDLGRACIKIKKKALLNALIINKDGCPGEDWFTWYRKNILESRITKKEFDNNKMLYWGKEVASCFKSFHIPQDRTDLFKNTKNMNSKVK